MKRKLILIVMVLLGSIWHNLNAQKMTAMRNVTDGGYNFWIYEPNLQTEELKPLIIFLHGASLKGTDMRKVLKYGPLNAASRGIRIDAYVVAPQTSTDWNADKIWKCVEWAKEHYPIDTDKISVIGMSLGGFGTFTLATKYYDKLSAGMMLCGGNTNEQYCGLTKMPFWIMHGTADKAVPISRSNSIVAGMAACGDTSRLIYTKLQGANHGFPARMFYLTETYDWLISHSLKGQDRAVNRNIKISQEMITNAYGRLSGEQNAVNIENNPPSDTTKTNIEAAEKQEKASTASEKKQGTVKNQANPKYHIVKKGDSLYKIARRYGTTVAILCKLNKIDENSLLQIGQKIKLPKRK